MKKLLIIIWVTFGLNTSIIAGPIHDAAGAKDLDEIKSLIEIGVSVDHRDKNDLTALMISIAQNDFETADFLVSVGADVNAKTKKYKMHTVAQKLVGEQLSTSTRIILFIWMITAVVGTMNCQ